MVGMNCLLYVDNDNVLVGCQSGQLASLDLSSMQITSQVNNQLAFRFSNYLFSLTLPVIVVYISADGAGSWSVSAEGFGAVGLHCGCYRAGLPAGTRLSAGGPQVPSPLCWHVRHGCCGALSGHLWTHSSLWPALRGS